MSTQSLQDQHAELETRTNELQIEAAEKRFEINFDDRKLIKTLMDHLNKGYTWKTNNAAVIVSLYDQLKTQAKEYANAEDMDTYVIKLRGHELNALYQALLSVEGQGIENARRFITMLTHVGETVSLAMTELAALNAEINDCHTRLAELEAALDAEQVEPELETADNEASK